VQYFSFCSPACFQRTDRHSDQREETFIRIHGVTTANARPSKVIGGRFYDEEFCRCPARATKRNRNRPILAGKWSASAASFGSTSDIISGEALE
jgi:hypothetical protein